jgi:DNA-directed RNA polymerase subunit RPC12/RpoP
VGPLSRDVSRTRAYRCLNCLEHTIDREFDASHLSVTCPTCGSFERFVNEAVFQQFEAFETAPPSEFDWNRLDRTEKLVVAERLVRSTKTLADFKLVDGETAAASDDSVAADGDSAAADDGPAAADSDSVEADDGPVAADDEPVEADDETANGDPADGDGSSEGSTTGVARGAGGETA